MSATISRNISFFKAENNFNNREPNNSTQANISFWGKRQVRCSSIPFTMQTQTGRVELGREMQTLSFYDILDAFHKDIQSLSIADKAMLPTKERIAGINLLITLRRYYVGGARNINCITALFLFIRDQWHKITSPSSHALIEENVNNITHFRVYRDNANIFEHFPRDTQARGNLPPDYSVAMTDAVLDLMPDYPVGN